MKELFVPKISPDDLYCLKIVHVRSFSGPYFPAFGLSMEIYGVSLWSQSDCEKMRTRKTPNTYTSNVVLLNNNSFQRRSVNFVWHCTESVSYLSPKLEILNAFKFRIKSWVPDGCTAWKVSKYGVFSGPYFLVFELNTEIYEVNLRIQSEYRKIKTRKYSVFGHFSGSDVHAQSAKYILGKWGLYLHKNQFSIKKNWNITTIIEILLLLKYTINITTIIEIYYYWNITTNITTI